MLICYILAKYRSKPGFIKTVVVQKLVIPVSLAHLDGEEQGWDGEDEGHGREEAADDHGQH